jgi:LuxR family maltose regulon positive regulatory protein
MRERRNAVNTPRASPLLTAKLHAPNTPDAHVRRARLLTLLDESARAPVTVVSAPAGAGKTALVASWIDESPGPAAWMSLDETDCDAVHFWTSLIAAMERLRPGCGKRALARLCRGADYLGEVVEDLLEDLVAEDHPQSFIVIDNLDVVDDDAVSRSLSLFLQHLPSWLHVLLLSRREPRLPLDRWRVRGQLGEVHFPELRFSPAEARQLLTQLLPTLPVATVDAAVNNADGWAAGLQLAALSARSALAQGNVETMVPPDDTLAHDYIWHEVLRGEPPELVETLLDLAVVDKFNVSLAEALTDRPDAVDRLRLAQERGLFVTRLGPPDWFELHALARRALTRELASRSPSRLAEQHARAAMWFEAVGEVPTALNHWCQAGRSRDALRLLAAEAANLSDNGYEATIRRVIAAIPVEVANADVESMIEFAWSQMFVDRRRFHELVDELTWLASSSTDPTVQARTTMLKAMAETNNGDWVQGGALARQGIRDFGPVAWRDPLGRFGWNLVAREIALSERWDDTSDEVLEVRRSLAHDPHRRLAFEGTRALGTALAGWPIDALRVAAGVRHASASAEMLGLRTELGIAEAIAHRELGDRARAAAELTGLADIHAEAMIYTRILACLELAQLHIDEGDLDSARISYEQAAALVEADSFGQPLRDWVTRVGVRLRLAGGQLEEAQGWSERVADPFWNGIDIARVRLAAADRTAAAEAVRDLQPRCLRHDVVLGTVHARTASNREEAVKRAAAAAEQAANAGLLQTLASEGPEVIELVERAAWRVSPSWLTRLRRAAGARGVPVEPPKLIEPLTDRERDILRFLPSRLTVREIAEELYISVNTLKFHLKVIYRKLGVSSRTEAADVARRTTHPRS